MKKATQGNVTKALKAKGLPMELVQGDGYCYFVYDDVAKNIFETHSEWTNRVSDMEFDRWIDIGVKFAETI